MQMDNVLVSGRDQAEHDARLTATLKNIESTGVTLNPDKCELINPPINISELRRFMGVVN